MSRLIVRGLPAKITEKQLRDSFDKFGRITDVSLKYTKEGVFRKFAFIGFEKEECGRTAISQLNNTFIKTSKVVVEECLPFSAENKPRPWSKYAKGSSAYKRLHPDEGENKDVDRKKKGDLNNNDFATKLVAKRPKLEEGVITNEENKESFESTARFDKFLRDQGIPTLVDDETPSSMKNENDDEKKIANFIASFKGDRKLSLLYRGLPAAMKPKNLREWISPVRLETVQYLCVGTETLAIVSFKRPPDVRRALKQTEQYLGGCKVHIEKMAESKDEISKSSQNDASTSDELEMEKRKIHDAISDTGRLFLRNLPYVCTDADIMEVFRAYGEIAEVQCIVSKGSGQCKGFAMVTYIFPDNALAAYEALDGSIFKGRMLHILPGECKRESQADNIIDGKNGNRLSQFQLERAKKLKSDANARDDVWNPLFVGANATADALAQRLEVGKRELLTGTGDNSAAVRLALAETQLVKETRDFLDRQNIQIDDTRGDRSRVKRSDTTILIKNMPAGTRFEEQLRNNFARFGDVKSIEFSPGGGLSAIVEMGNKVDAKRAFNFIAYSRLDGSDQPLYLEWAARMITTDNGDCKGLPITALIENHDAKLEVKSETEFDEEKETEEDKKRTKLIVRNIPFQASLEEVTHLFASFGELRDVRLPKKVGSTSAHRGFGFIDFASHADARRADIALRQSTHLYGRRLVLEWAKSDATVEELREKSANKLSKKKAVKGTKRQIRDAVDNHAQSRDEEN